MGFTFGVVRGEGREILLNDDILNVRELSKPLS